MRSLVTLVSLSPMPGGMADVSQTSKPCVEPASNAGSTSGTCRRTCGRRAVVHALGDEHVRVEVRVEVAAVA